MACSVRTIGRWKRQSSVHLWARLVVRWVRTCSPADLPFAHSRWSCEAVAVARPDDFRVRVGRATVRRWLHDAGRVWPRPLPVRPTDPDRGSKRRARRAVLQGRPADATAVFPDEGP